VFSELHLIRDGRATLARFVAWIVAVLRVDCDSGGFVATKGLTVPDVIRALNVCGVVTQAPVAADSVLLVPREFLEV
jgi:hypothetical protein